MDLQLQDKIALVTGGSLGLGRAIVRKLAGEGARVAFTYREHVEEAGALQAEQPDRLLALPADASDFSRAQQVVAEVVERYGTVDILVNNVGRGRESPIWSMTEDDWDSVIALTLKSAFNYTRAVAPLFLNKQAGSVLFIGSINGLRGREGNANYCAAKAGLVGLMKTAAKELGRYSVNVNLVAPGYIDTEGQRSTPQLIKDLVLKECAIQRLGQPGEIADVVAFLCSPAARHITGEVIKVDAGQYI